jgi:hypothetical protein
VSLKRTASEKCRKLHKEELHDFYGSFSNVRRAKCRRLQWGGDLGKMGRKESHADISMERSLQKYPLGRPRSRCKDNIKI